MIKAIIFDCFGVLTNDGWIPFKRKYFAHDPARFEQATDLNKQVDSGLATHDDLIKGSAELAGITDAAARREIEDNPVEEKLFKYIAEKLKPSYKIGLLSNAGTDWLPKLFTPAQLALFDAVALSFETGVIKPDARAYQIIAERLGVETTECVFIDDQERFAIAAQDAGMIGVTYENPSKLLADLNKILAK